MNKEDENDEFKSETNTATEVAAATAASAASTTISTVAPTAATVTSTATTITTTVTTATANMSGIKPPQNFTVNSELDMSVEWTEWIELYENLLLQK